MEGKLQDSPRILPWQPIRVQALSTECSIKHNFIEPASSTLLRHPRGLLALYQQTILLP